MKKSKVPAYGVIERNTLTVKKVDKVLRREKCRHETTRSFCIWRGCFVLSHYFQELLVASCLLFSPNGALSTFFTVRVFRSVTPYAETSPYFMSTFFYALVPCLLFSRRECFVLSHHMQELLLSSCLLFSRIGALSTFLRWECFVLLHYMQKLLVASCLCFSRLGTLSTFFTVRVFRSLTTHAGNLRFFMSTFFTDWYLVCLFTFKNVSFCYTICRNVTFLHVYFFHGYVPCLPFSRRECFILSHHM